MQINPGAGTSSVFTQWADSISQYAGSSGDSQSAGSTATDLASTSTSSQPPAAPSFNPDVPGAGAGKAVWTIIGSDGQVGFSYGVSSPCAPSSFPWIALSSQEIGLADAATGDTLTSAPDGQYNVEKSNGQDGALTDGEQLGDILDGPLISGNITAANFSNAVQIMQDNGTPLTQGGIAAAYNYISTLTSNQDGAQQTPQSTVYV